MTRKEKKKFMAKMALEEELRKIEENTANMGSFAVSQQESSGKDIEGDDIKIDNFSISGNSIGSEILLTEKFSWWSRIVQRCKAENYRWSAIRSRWPEWSW